MLSSVEIDHLRAVRVQFEYQVKIILTSLNACLNDAVDFLSLAEDI